MRIYECLFTGDELISDAYDLVDKGAVIEVQSWRCPADSADGVNIGANASQEEQAEELDDTVQMVNNIAYKFSLENQGHVAIKDTVTKYIQQVGKRVGKDKPDEKEKLQKELAEFHKEFKSNLKKDKEYYEYYYSQTFFSERYDENNGLPMPILAYFPEGKDAPVFCFFKEGMKGVKC